MHAETVRILAQACDIFDGIAGCLPCPEGRTGNVNGIGPAVDGCEADVYISGRSQQFQCFQMLQRLKLGGSLGGVLGAAGELAVVFLGGSLVAGLLGGGGNGEEDVVGVLGVGAHFQIFLVGLNGLGALAALGVGAGDELVGVGALYVAVGLFQGLDGLGGFTTLEQGLALFEVGGGDKAAKRGV